MAGEHTEPLSPHFEKGKHGISKKIQKVSLKCAWLFGVFSELCLCFSTSDIIVVIFAQKPRVLISMAKHRLERHPRADFTNLRKLNEHAHFPNMCCRQNNSAASKIVLGMHLP